MTVEMISHLLEALMILCFGLSWPLSIYKSWTSRTAKGKSLYFGFGSFILRKLEFKAL